MKSRVGHPGGFPAAFSLVEVVLALGIVAFCLVGLIGLLPVGLTTARNAQEEASAAGVFADLANAIRDAKSDQTGLYRPVGVLSNLSWTTGSIKVGGDFAFSLSGNPSGTDSRVKARVEILPPGTARTPGSALISLAWPSSSVWNESSARWDRAQGSLTSRIIFLPRP